MTWTVEHRLSTCVELIIDLDGNPREPVDESKLPKTRIPPSQANEVSEVDGV
ncbi:MAG: hypothetical protein WCK65_14245 [Rhodospirillaceae bacterium]